MRKVLVTGASGFIGRHVAAALDGDPTLVVIRTARTPHEGIDVAVDLADADATRRLVDEVRSDTIVHAAGLRHGQPRALTLANIATTRNLLAAIREAEIACRFLLVGSAAEYGTQPAGRPIAETADCRPVSPYGRTKLAAARLALWYRAHCGVDATVLRLFNIVGPGMGGLPGDVARQIGGKLRLDWNREAPSLPMVRDFLGVDDVAQACRRAIAAETLPPVVNLCTGHGTSFGALLDRMQDLAGIPLGHPQLPLGEDRVIGDPALCQALLGLRPSPDLDDMLRAAIAAERNRN